MAKKTRKLSPWIKLVTQTYNANKNKPGYEFKDAIKDAKKVYKKDGSVKQSGKGMDVQSSAEGAAPSSVEQKAEGMNKKKAPRAKNMTAKTKSSKKTKRGSSIFSSIFG